MFKGANLGPGSMTTQVTTQTATHTTTQTTTQTATQPPARPSTPAPGTLSARAGARTQQQREARKAIRLPGGLWQDGIKNIKSQTAPKPLLRSRSGNAPKPGLPPGAASNALKSVAPQAPLRGQRLFGFGTSASVQPGKPIEKMTEVDQMLQDITHGGTPVHDLSDIETLLGRLEPPKEPDK